MNALGLSVIAFRDGLRPGREAELVARARDLGFAFIEPALRGDRTPSVLPLADAPTLTTLEFRRCSLCADDEASRALAFEAASRLVAAAGRAGGALASFSTGPCAHADLSACIERVGAALARLQPLAAGQGVQLAVENAPAQLTRSCGQVKALLAAAPPEVGLCLDFANALDGEPLPDWFECLSEQVVKLHISDAVRTGGGLRPAFPGRGEVDWRAVRTGLSYLRAGVLTVLEFVPGLGADEDAEAGAARAAALDLAFG